MSKLAEFLKERKELNEEVKKKSEETLIQWKREIDTLFSKIDSWLELAKSEGLVVKRLEGAKEITERLLGTYKTPVLEIRFADKIVRLEPVGRYIIGGYGRIDIFSPNGVYTLVKLSPEEDEWFLVDKKGTKRKLTRDLFEDFLIKAFSN